MNSALPGIGIRATFGALYPYEGREVPPLGGCCSGGVVDMELLSVNAPVPGRARAPGRSDRDRKRTLRRARACIGTRLDRLFPRRTERSCSANEVGLRLERLQRIGAPVAHRALH